MRFRWYVLIAAGAVALFFWERDRRPIDAGPQIEVSEAFLNAEPSEQYDWLESRVSGGEPVSLVHNGEIVGVWADGTLQIECDVPEPAVDGNVSRVEPPSGAAP